MPKEKHKIIDKLSKPSNSSKCHRYKNKEIEEREPQEFINIILKCTRLILQIK